MPAKNEEPIRLEEARDGKAPWKKWGPYLSERQWGTVREDYSDNGDLLSSRFADWFPLVFPLWVLVLSIYILIENLRGTKPSATA